MKISDIQYKFLKVDEFNKKELPLPRFSNDVRDAHGNEVYGEFIAIAPGYDWDNPDSDKLYGYIDFTIDKVENVTRINMIRTNKAYDRMGIAAELIHQLSLNHGTTLEPTLATSDGSKLITFLQKHGYFKNPITEALSSDDLEMLDAAGYSLIEEIDISPYSLYLIDSPYEFLGTSLQVGLNRDGKPMVDYYDQNIKHPVTTDDISLDVIPVFVETVNKWVDQYKRIMIISQNKRYERIYKKLIVKYTDLKLSETTFFESDMKVYVVYN